MCILCSVLQQVVVCCSMLQRVAVRCSVLPALRCVSPVMKFLDTSISVALAVRDDKIHAVVYKWQMPAYSYIHTYIYTYIHIRTRSVANIANALVR